MEWKAGVWTVRFRKHTVPCVGGWVLVGRRAPTHLVVSVPDHMHFLLVLDTTYNYGVRSTNLG